MHGGGIERIIAMLDAQEACRCSKVLCPNRGTCSALPVYEHALASRC